MKKKKQSSSVEDIQSRYQAYEKFYQQLHDDQKEIDDYYELVFDAKVPTNYPTRMPSTARDWIDVGVRHFTLDNPKAKVYPRNDGEKASNQVALLETGYNFWLRKDIRIIKNTAKKLLLRGEAFIRVNMDDTYFGTKDEERLFHFPLSISDPDPINVYCSPAHEGLVPHDVIEKYDITVAEAQWLCESNGWKWTTTKKPDTNVEWFSYYSAKDRYFSINGEPVLTPEIQLNIFGFCPYVHIGAGFGQSNYEGKPEYMYRSIIWGKRDMLKMEVRVLSALDAINSRYAWPRWKASLIDVAVMDELRKLYPGGQVPTDPEQWLYEIIGRVEIKIQEGETVPPALFQQYALIQSEAQAPEVLSGSRPAGVYSGQHQEALIATAKPIYKDAFKNLEEGLGVAMGMGAKIIEQVYNYPVQIKNFASDEKREYRKLSPSDIAGHYDCEVQLLAEPPEATDNRKALGKALWQAGAISMLTMLTKYFDYSEKEAMDEIAQIAAEQAMKEPAVRMVVAKNAMSRLGMKKELEQLEQVEKGLVESKPPIQQGEGLNLAGVSRRGYGSPELESMPTAKEEEVARV